MSLFYFAGINLFVQMPRSEEKSSEGVKEIFGKKATVLCFGSCLGRPKCPYHSNEVGCDNEQKLLEKYRQENN